MTIEASAAGLSSGVKLKGYLQRTRTRLSEYRPRWRDRRFWILQALSIFLVALHYTITFGIFHSDLETLYFLPVSLLLVPIVYAAFTYGFVGAIATTLWVVALTIPDVIFGYHGLQRVGVISALLLLSGIASFIGRQVDRQRELQKQTENSAVALKASTMKYQGLLQSNPIAVLVVSRSGGILEVNPAAGLLFGKSKVELEGMRLPDLLGKEDSAKILGNSFGGGQQAQTLTLNAAGRQVFLEPRLTESNDGQGNPVTQILLRDVTEEYQRRAGLRAYAAEVLRALEEERQLMARELHDETIQTLILLCNQLNDAEEMAPSSPLLAGKLKDARKNAEEIVKGLRNFAKSLRPPILDDLGITVSIRRLLADFTERAKIKVQLAVVGEDRRLPSNAELGLFRITQETLRNVERHANATHVSVTITFTEHGVRLDVTDNGVGLSVPAASGDFSASGHLGLISMQERAQLLGGGLEIESSPGHGTRVTVSVNDTDKVSQPSHRIDI